MPPSSTCATIVAVETVGVRELRQHASDLLRRVEAGEQITITVAGRPSARLVAVGPQTWRTDADIRVLFRGAEDPDWDTDRDLVDQSLRDPWST
jgi:prevent-host-death family protein